jgi:TadE-like protein
VLVEFALILPVFCLLVFLVFDVGRALNYWIDETHLASEGARLAAVNRVPNGGDLKDYIRAQADTDELREGGTDSVSDPLEVCIEFPVDADGTSGEVGDPVKVTVSTTYNWLPIIDMPVTSSSLVGSATHRLEREPSYSEGCTT